MPSFMLLSALKRTFLQNHAKNLGPKLKTRVCQLPVLLFKASMADHITPAALLSASIAAQLNDQGLGDTWRIK